MFLVKNISCMFIKTICLPKNLTFWANINPGLILLYDAFYLENLLSSSNRCSHKEGTCAKASVLESRFFVSLFFSFTPKRPNGCCPGNLYVGPSVAMAFSVALSTTCRLVLCRSFSVLVPYCSSPKSEFQANET